MWTWLTSPPVLIMAVLASVIGIGQALRGLARNIVLFPRRRAEQQIGHALVPILAALASGKGMKPPEDQDWSMYKA